MAKYNRDVNSKKIKLLQNKEWILCLLHVESKHTHTGHSVLHIVTDWYSLPEVEVALSRSSAWPPRAHMRRVTVTHTRPNIAAIGPDQVYKECSQRSKIILLFCSLCSLSWLRSITLQVSKFSDSSWALCAASLSVFWAAANQRFKSTHSHNERGTGIVVYHRKTSFRKTRWVTSWCVNFPYVIKKRWVILDLILYLNCLQVT